MGKTKKFNIIDVIILAIIVLAAAFFVWSYAIRPSEQNAVNNKDVYNVTMVMDNVEVSNDNFENGKINVGDRVSDRISGTYLGVVKSIETKESRTYLPTDDGEMILTSRPLNSHLIVTIEGQAKVSDKGGLWFGSLQLLGNKSAEIVIKDSVFWLRFIDFTLGEPVN